MVADAVVEDGAKPTSLTAETPEESAPPKIDDASKDADTPIEDVSADPADAGLLTGAALFVVQQQTPEPDATAAATGATAVDTNPAKAGKSGIDTLQITASDTPAPAEPGKVSTTVEQPVAATATAAAADKLLASTLGQDAATVEQLTAEVAAQARADKKAEAPAASVSTYAAPPSSTDLLTDAPARHAAHAFGDAASNASAGDSKTDAEATEVSGDKVKGDAQSAFASKASASAPQSAAAQSTAPSPATAANSTFATQMQAQGQAADPAAAASTDTVPTPQGQPAAQAAATATAPVVASFSGLSRATLETTVQIAAQITRQLAGRATRFELGLTPEGLGKVNVSMDIDANGQLTAQLAFDNPLAAADLRARADELRGQLQDAGFKLADDALTFSQQDAAPSDGGPADQKPDQNHNRAFATASRMADADLASSVPAWVSLSLTPRGVDMKV